MKRFRKFLPKGFGGKNNSPSKRKKMNPNEQRMREIELDLEELKERANHYKAHGIEGAEKRQMDYAFARLEKDYAEAKWKSIQEVIQKERKKENPSEAKVRSLQKRSKRVWEEFEDADAFLDAAKSQLGIK